MAKKKIKNCVICADKFSSLNLVCNKCKKNNPIFAEVITNLLKKTLKTIKHEP